MLKPIDLSDAASWKVRYRAPLFLLAASADSNPARGMVISRRDAFQVYAWLIASGELRLLTDRSVPTPMGWITPDGSYVYFLNDQQGNELGHLNRVPFEGGAFEDVTPTLPAYTLRGVSLSRNGQMLAFDAVNAEGFQLYCVQIGSGHELSKPRLIFTSEKEAWGALLSSDGTLAAMISTARADGQRRRSLLAIDTADGHLVGEVWDGPQADIEIVRFSPLPDDRRILAMTSRSDLKRPFVWNPVTDERLDLACDNLEGEIIPLDWSPDGNQILLCQVNRAQQVLYLYDLSNQTLLRLQHPSGTYYFPFIGVPGECMSPWFGSTDEIWGLWQDSIHPRQIIALDRFTGTPRRILLKPGDVPSGGSFRSTFFSSSDGQEIQAWLGLPDGEPPFPVVLYIHGGPHTVQADFFSPLSQTWLDHGFGFCAINYRGSTTFGRRFKEQIWGDVGHWELEDVVAAHAWLVEQRLAIPNAVFLFGGSYGGYLTLLALGQRPELWAGGMAWVAIADMIATYEDSSDALKSFYAGLFGGTPAEKREQYIASSPITYAEYVQSPVLIFQGKNDTRTPPRQMELYEAKMDSLGKAIEVEWFETGHDGSGTEEEIHQLERMLLFARQILETQHKNQ